MALQPPQDGGADHRRKNGHRRQRRLELSREGAGLLVLPRGAEGPDEPVTRGLRPVVDPGYSAAAAKVCAPTWRLRSSRPGVAPVHRPSSKVISPLTMVQR